MASVAIRCSCYLGSPEMKDGKPWRQRRAETVMSKTFVKKEHNPHKPRGIIPWSAPYLFNGCIVAIVGGGPSLKPMIESGELAQLAKDAGPSVRWVAVNNSYKIAPWADLMHFADCQWWRWNGKHVLATWPREKLITTATSDITHVHDPRIKRFWRDRDKFNKDRSKLHGWDSGTQAVCLARHLGAKKIVLFGFDMQTGPNGETQWHNEHQRKTVTLNYQQKFRPALERTVRALTEEKIVVVRATNPGMSSIPYVEPTAALALGG